MYACLLHPSDTLLWCDLGFLLTDVCSPSAIVWCDCLNVFWVCLDKHSLCFELMPTIYNGPCRTASTVPLGSTLQSSLHVQLCHMTFGYETFCSRILLLIMYFGQAVEQNFCIAAAGLLEVIQMIALVTGCYC